MRKLNLRADKNCKKCLGTGVRTGIDLIPYRIREYPCNCVVYRRKQRW